MHNADRDEQFSAGCLLEKFMSSALVRKEQRSPESKGISMGIMMGIMMGISQRTEPSASTNLEPHLEPTCQLDDFTVDGEYDPSAQLRGRRSLQVSSELLCARIEKGRTINRANRGVVPPHNLVVPSSRMICT